LPMSVRITLIARWVASAVGANMHGQPPSITVMPQRRPYAAAAGETLPSPVRGASRRA
jgi:hypothetical protein